MVNSFVFIHNILLSDGLSLVSFRARTQTESWALLYFQFSLETWWRRAAQVETELQNVGESWAKWPWMWPTGWEHQDKMSVWVLKSRSLQTHLALRPQCEPVSKKINKIEHYKTSDYWSKSWTCFTLIKIWQDWPGAAVAMMSVCWRDIQGTRGCREEMQKERFISYCQTSNCFTPEDRQKWFFRPCGYWPIES